MIWNYPDQVRSIAWLVKWLHDITEDKAMIDKTFQINREENNKYIIFMTTNAYSIGINNLDIKLVIYWNFVLNFDLMIQWIGKASKKNRQTIFILLILK